MQNVYSSAFTVTCVPSHNLLRIHVKMDIFIEMRRIFLQGDECFFCNGKWFKNRDCKINLAQRNGIPGEIPFGVCTLPRLNMPTADRKAVFNGVKISSQYDLPDLQDRLGKQGSGIPG